MQDAAVSLVILKDFHDYNHHEMDLEDKSLDLRDSRAYIRTRMAVLHRESA